MYMRMGGWCLTTGGAKALVYTVALMHSASSPHSKVTVGTIPTTLHGI